MINSTEYNIENSSGSKGYALFLAILPVIMMYQAPIFSFGMSTLLIAGGMFYAIYVLMQANNHVDKKLVFLIALYLIWVATKATDQGIMLCIAIILHLAAFSTGAVNVAFLRKCLEYIALAAAVCVISQQVYHIVVGGTIVFINTDILLPMMDSYIEKIHTGISTNENMYRPSAFFLEPAGFANFTIYGLGSLLFRDVPQLKKATLITIGLFASTSGLGFVLAFAIWGWWYVNRKTQKTIRRMMPQLIVFAILAIAVYNIMLHIPFFESVISRFNGSENVEYDAIEGRTFWWETYFGDKSISDLMFGYGEEKLPEEYFTGFMKILYAYGVIGLVLYLLFLIRLLFVSNDFAKTYIIIYIGCLFFANQTGFIPIIFNIGCIISFIKIRDSSEYGKLV